MSVVPMGLFKKPNRKFRQRVAHDSDEESAQQDPDDNNNKEKKQRETQNASGPESSTERLGSASCSSSNRNGAGKDEKNDSQPVIPATKLLSFHDEEDDGETFKLKKSNYSRRLARQLEKERKKRSEISCTTTSSKALSNIESDLDVDDRGEEKKQSKESWNVLSGKEAEDMDVEEEEEEKDVKKENPFRDVLQSGVIPDAATIYAMKKHRQMAREMGDYIPLEGPEKEEEHSKSRLIREDDNDRSDDDDDDEPSRLSFTVNTGAVERQKVREAFLSLQEGPSEGLENEDAAELDRWEQEQIRKGVSLITQIGPTQPQVAENQYYSYMPAVSEESPYYSSVSSSVEANTITTKSTMPNIKPPNKSDLTTSTIKARLEERLSNLKSLHKSHEEEIESCRKEVEEATNLTKRLELEAPEVARRFTLYQQMRGYVRDLVECLDLKVSHIEVLDTKLMELYKSRAKRLISRRQQDIRDQADEYALISSKILKGSNSEIAGEKNGCIDENRLRRAAEREGRRMRRRKQRERSQLLSKHQEGMSSDDEEPDIELIKFREKQENILNECKEVFEDVVDEFGTVQGIMKNFENWKSEQRESYCEAFVPLCLPKIFSPFVRLEMLCWNPLEDDIDFEATYWYRYLTFYSCSDSDGEMDQKDDPDANLLPCIAEKTLVPKLTAFIKDVWDPMSSKQNSNLVSLISKMHEDYPTIAGKSKQVQIMLQAVSTRIVKCLDDDVYIPLYPKELLENRSSGSSIFFQRQFWSTVKLLTNILAWTNILADGPLQDMALSSLLNRYLIMGLHTSMVMRDTLDKCKAILACLPKAWFAGLKGSNTLHQLRQFSQFLVKYAQSFQSSSSKRAVMEEEEIRDIVKDIIQMLIAMNSLDDAVILAQQFSISGLKKEK